MQRNAFCFLSFCIYRFVIDQILSESLREEIVDKINTFLMQLATKIQENSLPQLTKNPEDYPDKKNLCHVQVALRLNSKGGKKLRQGDTVTYVICNVGTELPYWLPLLKPRALMHVLFLYRDSSLGSIDHS
ncbi:hypothetical protein HPB48_011511 [Haemaphysalis longicornis]|uniref:DNA-directed DNA polymerase n=1 Tax=Haemaphysalis longicornis TaxID=44386 RepID=A0A9J6G3D8_HAELO|nr:hypothetical protein HPB48_011511 [Haemaphysalis longicornis]